MFNRHIKPILTIPVLLSMLLYLFAPANINADTYWSSAEETYKEDINEDGKVNIFDLLALLRVLSGAVEPSPYSVLAPISIYDKENLLEISIEDIEKYHGEIGPGLPMAFRATQLAISELWLNEIPHRVDFKIITAHPTLGSQDCFDFITRAKTRPCRKGDFIVELPEGTSKENMSKDNFVFTFVKKPSDEQIKMWVKEEIFPANWFELRLKVKFSEPAPATPEEKKLFKKLKEGFKASFMNLPVDEIFGFEKSL